MTVQRYDHNNYPFNYDRYYGYVPFWRRHRARNAPDVLRRNYDGSRFECVECGCWHELKGARRVRGHGYVCLDCLEAGLQRGAFLVCEECGAAMLRSALSFDYDGGVLCRDCFDRSYFMCECCEEVFPTDERTIVANGDSVCEGCYDECCVTCEGCGDIVYREEANYHYGEWYCECCHDRLGGVHDYGYKPTPIFHGSAPDNLFLGVELEADDGDVPEFAGALRRFDRGHEDYLYLKHDGSLNDGVEIVTHPCSLRYHLDTFPWADVLQLAKDSGLRSHDTDTCGLHIHVSRDSLGSTWEEQDLTAAKLTILLDRFWYKFVKFSRRRTSQLDSWANKPDADVSPFDDEKTAICKAKDASDHTRYKALNLRPYATVEFRLYRGTLNLDTLRATLAFTAGLVRYAKASTLEEVLNTSWHDMMGAPFFYVEGAAAALSQYLTQRGLTRD